ncbi:uncharacterized protein LOC124436138 [Xenia sp. Carnegie-2017]|uniref:uncharacterized protein LOC124436138 n=1 Tax=Xenia sp. Carnegie-2017 TaxID=2897299 RepID=UPI001F03369A|nr:uncharacterized protein LOC124436138 [Xenia sp. Carnegie-2017]
MANNIGAYSLGSWFTASICLLAAVCTLGTFMIMTNDVIEKWNDIGALTYGLSVITVSLISLVFIIVFYLRKILNDESVKVLWGRVIVALLVLTAGCVLAKAHTNYDNNKKNTVEGLMTFCQWLKKSSNHGNCDYLVWSSVSSMSSFVNRHL